MRSHHHWLAQRAGLDQVVRAIRQETAADDGDITSGKIGGHLAHAVTEQNPGAASHRLFATAALKRNRVLREQCRHRIETLRVARHHQYQRRGAIVRRQCLQK